MFTTEVGKGKKTIIERKKKSSGVLDLILIYYQNCQDKLNWSLAQKNQPNCLACSRERIHHILSVDMEGYHFILNPVFHSEILAGILMGFYQHLYCQSPLHCASGEFSL